MPDALGVIRSPAETFRELIGARGHERAGGSDGAPAQPSSQRKRKAVVIGAGLAGLTAAIELLDAGFAVDVYESRNFAGGKVGSWVDRDGNHIEMGLHVFFGCYYNVFDVMRKLGVLERNFRVKQHRHVFVNRGARVGELDFRLFGRYGGDGVGAPINGLKAFLTTAQLSALDKARNALALGTSPIVRALFDFDGAMRQVRELDRMTFSEWFLAHGGSRGSIERLWNPIAYALGFLDCDHISARCMLTIFQLFAVRSEASMLRMLQGSPNEYLTKPMVEYIERKGGRVMLRRGVREFKVIGGGGGDDAAEEAGEGSGGGGGEGGGERLVGVVVRGQSQRRRRDGEQDREAFTPAINNQGERDADDDDDAEEYVAADYIIAAVDVPGIQRLVPHAWRARHPFFDKIFKLTTVPVATVMLRFDGWVTELSGDPRVLKRVHADNTRASAYQQCAAGIDNLLYTPDADFSCFADMALASPADYYRAGEGSLLQCVLTPAHEYMRMADADIVARVVEQVRELFPSARELQCTWSNVVKLAQSLYREAAGVEAYRPGQRTPIRGLYLAGSYTQQDYIDSQEGAVRSGRMAAAAVLEDVAAEGGDAARAEAA